MDLRPGPPAHPARRAERERRRRPVADLAGHARDPGHDGPCLLYTSDAADERSSVDLGGRRIIKKKKHKQTHDHAASTPKSTH